MKQLRRAFVTGVLILVPLVATIDILLWFISTIDRSVARFLPVMPFGSGILISLGMVIAVGLLFQNRLGAWAVNEMDSWLRRVHVVGGLYSGIKKFLETIISPRSDQFSGVVLVPFPRTGIYSIGFRTGKPDPKLNLPKEKELTSVFVPCTPNPTSGFYLLIPEDELVALDISVQEAFKIVISMGLVTSEAGHGRN
ncbi:MAG: DUF502 domain-containing protein [Deltaproteobacteria bacterium]|nr:DUF502 domain-containing protein [Deltaproteobacteria bacterium]MBI3296146.1 DUF502 domain-containing protein [Deltaproteobacteria bacterium]